MSMTCEQWTLACYLSRLARRFEPDSSGAAMLAAWLEQNQALVGLAGVDVQGRKAKGKGCQEDGQ